MYYLDRSFAPSHKVRAFTRAAQVVAGLSEDRLAALVANDSLTSLDGVGASTGAVIGEAIRGETGGYLDALAAKTVVDPGVGGALRSSLRGDCHSHTTWSDGGASAELMARTARSLGHEYLVVTDHSPRLTVAHGLSAERLAAQRAEIDALNETLATEPGNDGFRVLRGNEVDICADGTLDLPDEVLADLDLVVASVHSKLAMAHDEMTERMIAAVSNPHVDILGHCTGRQIVGTPRAPSSFDARAVFGACAAHGTAVELNCRPERQDPPDELLSLALDLGCYVVINTDAHSPGQLEWQASGCIRAVEHDIDPARIINSYGVEELLAWRSA